MTCPYFSKNRQGVLCNVYGFIVTSSEKEAECHSHYAECFEEAREILSKREQVKGNLERETMGGELLGNLKYKTVKHLWPFCF